MRTFSRSLLARPLLTALALSAAACGSSGPADTLPDEQPITSNVGTALEMRFHGEVLAREGEQPRAAIIKQLQYLNGILVGDVDGNGQAAMPTLANITEAKEGALGQTRVGYDATVAVIWPNKEAVPETYDLVLPLDTTKLGAFNAKYDGTCGKNKYGQATFWHDFDPKAPGCVVDDGDVYRADVAVRPHPQATRDAYPEYDQVWKDGVLDLVAVYGIISANTPSDEGAVGREILIDAVADSIDDAVRTEHEKLPGIIQDSTVTGTITRDGKKLTVRATAILVQEAASAGSAFNARFAEASATSDIAIYDGHSGLGKNIANFAAHLSAAAGQYQFVYLFGCQTFAYLGPEMHDKRIALNGAESDPEGTKFLDIMATALPAYGDQGRSNIAIFKAFLDPSKPRTMNDLMNGISPGHLTLVFGEHDNSFEP